MAQYDPGELVLVFHGAGVPGEEEDVPLALHQMHVAPWKGGGPIFPYQYLGSQGGGMDCRNLLGFHLAEHEAAQLPGLGVELPILREGRGDCHDDCGVIGSACFRAGEVEPHDRRVRLGPYLDSAGERMTRTHRPTPSYLI